MKIFFRLVPSLILFALVLIPFAVAGQNQTVENHTGFTIEELQQRAEENYPLVKQYGLIEQSRDFTISNATRGYLPQIGLNAKVSFQSDVTQLPTAMPGVVAMNKDQYQATLELNQTIWDGGAVASQVKIARASSEAEKKKIEADLYIVRERVNQLYFGVLLLEEQLKQNDILIGELNNNLNKVKAYVENGIATGPDLDAVKVELLKASQRRDELKMTAVTYREMLAALTGAEQVKSISLTKPQGTIALVPSDNRRPELALLDAQMNLLTGRESAIKASLMPRLNFFVQGGYGNPGLNMLKNEFSTYYIGGVRLAWNFGTFYTAGNSKKLLKQSRESLMVQRETFLFNSRLEESRQLNEAEKLANQLKSDDEIISLRERIKRAAEVKVENGTMSVSDLIREINAENLARQEKANHEIMHLLAIYSIKYLKNN